MPLPQTRLSFHIRQSCGRGTDGRRDWWWRRCKGRGRSQTCPPRRTGQRDGQGRRSWEPVWTRDAEWQYPYRLNRIGLGLLRSPTLLRFLGKGRCVRGNSKGQVCCLKDKCWACVCLKRREWVQFRKPKSKWESSRRRRSIAKEREWIEWDPTSEQLVVPLCRALAALYTWMAERGALDGIPLEWHYLMVGTAAVSRIIGARSFGPPSLHWKSGPGTQILAGRARHCQSTGQGKKRGLPKQTKIWEDGLECKGGDGEVGVWKGTDWHYGAVGWFEAWDLCSSIAYLADWYENR